LKNCAGITCAGIGNSGGYHPREPGTIEHEILVTIGVAFDTETYKRVSKEGRQRLTDSNVMARQKKRPSNGKSRKDLYNASL
jgi:hypothetical protein